MDTGSIIFDNRQNPQKFIEPTMHAPLPDHIADLYDLIEKLEARIKELEKK